MCDLCFIPRCDCESSLVDSQTVTPAAASGSAVLDNPAPTVTDALALDSTQYWTSGTVRFGFPDTAAGFTGALSYYSPFNEPGTLRPLSDFGRDSLRDGFAQWDAVTALTIVEAAPGTTAEINVGASSIPPTAWAYYPGGQAANGDIWFNTSQWFLDALQGPSEPIIGSYAYATGIHEFGHALGLKHPHQLSGGGRAVLDPDYDAVEFSIMSYRSYPGGPTGAYTVESWGYPQSPMMLDIAMIQRIYGADYSSRSGDTIYTVSTANGEFFIDGVSQGVPGGNRVFRTIWDGDGADHVDLSTYATSMHADLNPGRGIRFDTDGTFQAALLANGMHAGFSIYMSLLHEGDTRSLIENLTTGVGNDILIGNVTDNVLVSTGGNNTFAGGLGADTFVLGSGADTIKDTLDGLDGDTVIGFDVTRDRFIVQDDVAGSLTAALAGGVLILTAGDTVARLVFEGLEVTLDRVQFVQDGTALEVLFEASGTTGEGDDRDSDMDERPDTPTTPDTPESLLTAAIADYEAAGRAVVTADGTGVDVKSPGWGAVLVGGDGFDRLREARGDDVMYGGSGPDQFVWDLRGGARTERDTILDLDFADGDVLRLLRDSGQTWIGSDAALADALASGFLDGARTDTGGIALWQSGAPARVLELAFHDRIDLPPITPDTPVVTDPVTPDTPTTPDTPDTPESLLTAAIADYEAAGRAVVTADGTGVDVKSPGWGAVLVGGDGFDRLREARGDDVMYGGSGPDQFVWDLRGGARTERDTILDLDFADGDVLRILRDSGQTWIGSDAALADALASGFLDGARTDTGGIALWQSGAPARVLELAFHDHIDIA